MPTLAGIGFLLSNLFHMVRKYHWYDPMLIRKMRLVLTVLTWTAWAIVLFLQHQRIVSLIQLFFQD